MAWQGMCSFHIQIKQNKFVGSVFKLVNHELGHVAGLDHCVVDFCLMRDANGKNTFASVTDFCIKCRKTLIQEGWTLK